MPNTITLAKNYVALLDEVYKAASVTNDLTSPSAVVRAGSQANTIVYPEITVPGLGAYSRSTGYVNGDVTVQWKEAAFNYDRGVKISVDAMDNEESKMIAFGRAAGELMRTQVAPEADAFTFAQLAGTNGATVKGEALAAGADVLNALYTAVVTMDESEVPAEGRQLYITPTLRKMIMQLDTTKSREILDAFSSVKEVPQSRFYTAITLSATNGYAPTAGGYPINFCVVDPNALIKFDKHVVSDIIPASLNADADADIVKYRKYGIVKVYENKVKGIYVSRGTTAVA